jgi:PPOX class probable F420-dependent enzyme
MIRSGRIAHLATADAQRQPHVIPICFVCDGKHFYSPIDEKPKSAGPLKLKRVRNIEVNPRVAIVIDHYEEDWKKLGYVLVFGTARILLGGKAHRDAVRLLRRKYPQYRNMAIESSPMIAVSPISTVVWGRV